MLYPIIRVRDNCGRKHEHIVGENSHDVLYIDNESGGIHYLNCQCMAGTRFPEEGYSFVGQDNGEFSISGQLEIEMVTLDELIEMATEHLEEATKAKIAFYRSMRSHWEEEMNECRKETGILHDTGGQLP